MRYTVRPISDHTWFRPSGQRTRSRFTATWSDTLSLLAREVDALGGRDVVFEVDALGGRDVVFEIDVAERGIRNDGMLRADARPTDPAVVVAFESKHGPLLYRSDQFSQLAWGAKANHPWQENVRAIALTLDALRAVDRYGATETGQQYAGFKALPAGCAMPASHMTADEAWSIIGSYQSRPITEFMAYASPRDIQEAHKRARAANHPDRLDGDRTLWDQVEQAAAVLGVAR